MGLIKKLAEDFGKPYVSKPLYGNPDLWEKATRGLETGWNCGNCNQQAIMRVSDDRSTHLLCIDCADKMFMACKHCGILVPASSNVRSKPVCMDCWEAHGGAGGIPLYQPKMIERIRHLVKQFRQKIQIPLNHGDKFL